MLYLKQSTASQAMVIGPFVADDDGNTPETGLTISNTDIRLSKNGANIVSKNSGGGTHDELGYYTITLDATDTNTVGSLQIMVHESGALPVYHEAWVLEEAIYDALFGASATGLLPANVTQFGGSNGTFASGRPEVNTTHAAGTAWASGAITANSIASNAFTSAKFAAGAFDAVWSVTTRLLTAGTNIALAKGTGITGFNDLSAAAVNAEVLDVLNTDTFAEPTGVPGATVTLAQKIGFLYMALRNKVTVTATKKTFFDDGDAAEWEKDLSDDGTTYTETEANSV